MITAPSWSEKHTQMSDDTRQIMNLVHRFGEAFDAGAFDDALALFSRGHFIVGEEIAIDAAAMRAMWDEILIMHDGAPRTRHVITNHIIEVDDARAGATCRSAYTVFQQAGSLPLQAVISGRYHDRFARDDDGWYFLERDYRLMDMIGDLSHHLTAAALQSLRVRE